MIMFADRTNWNLAPNRLSEALARHRAAGKPLLDLTVSNPTECGFVYDERAIFDALCNPADEVLIPAPSYPLFDFLADIQDVKPVRYPLIYDHGWQIDFHALAQAITPRTRAVIVVHPNNPTGHFTKRAEMEKLNAVC